MSKRRDAKRPRVPSSQNAEASVAENEALTRPQQAQAATNQWKVDETERASRSATKRQRRKNQQEVPSESPLTPQAPESLPSGQGDFPPLPELPADYKPSKANIWFAAEHNNLPQVQYLVERAGVDPSSPCKSHFNFTPLHYACYIGDLTMARYLLSKGADPSARNRVDRITPLYWAAFWGRESVADYILSFHNELPTESKEGRPMRVVDIGTKYDQNVLFAAAHGGCVSLIRRLATEFGFDVKSKEVLGESFHIAAQNGHVQACQALFELGADPTTASSKGLSPLDVAKHYKQEGVVSYLESVLSKV